MATPFEQIRWPNPESRHRRLRRVQPPRHDRGRRPLDPDRPRAGGRPSLGRGADGIHAQGLRLMAYNPAYWHDFYVMTGGAAAALTGLLFVAMSLHAREIMENRFYSDRAIGTLMSLASQLILSGAVLLPGQPIWLLGVEVEIAALFFLATTTR